MFAWVTNWLYTVYSGPARNAPNNGVNIKKFIEEKPPEIKTITQEDIVEALDHLKPVQQIQKPVVYSSPLMEEFNTVFNLGYKEYFEKRKSSKKLL